MELPLYKTIYYTLEEKLNNKDYKSEKYLPSETKLMSEYSCSRDTIRKALNLLIKENIIKPIRGKGYKIINTKSVDCTVDKKYRLLLEKIKNKDLYDRVIISFEEIIITTEMAKHTGLPVDKEAYKIIKKRTSDSTPVVLEETYYLKEFVPKLTLEIVQTSIYKYFHEQNFWDFNLENIVFTETLDNITLDFCNIKEFIPEHNLVIMQNFHAYDNQGNLFEFTHRYVHPDYFALRI